MSITMAASTTTKEYQATCTEPGTISRRTDSITMAMQVAPRRNIWIRLEMFSALAWPKEWAASARIATLPVSNPTSSLAPISTTLTRTEYSAATALLSNRPLDATWSIGISPYPYAHYCED